MEKPNDPKAAAGMAGLRKATSEPVRAFLRAAGYTPATLAVDMDISTKAARRVLYGKNTFTQNDIDKLNNLFGLNLFALIWENYAPGEIRATQQRWGWKYKPERK